MWLNGSSALKWLERRPTFHRSRSQFDPQGGTKGAGTASLYPSAAIQSTRYRMNTDHRLPLVRRR